MAKKNQHIVPKQSCSKSGTGTRPMTEFPFRFVYFSPEAVSSGGLSSAIKRSLKKVLAARSRLSSDASKSLAVVLASEIITDGQASLPQWVDVETRYLVLADIPEPALYRLPTILRIHKPDQRIHVTRDPGAVRRQAIALDRDPVHDGIVDAYLLEPDFCLVLGDMSIRSLPLKELPFLSDLDQETLRGFEIHSSGSYVHWPDLDLRVGASQFLQAVDPMYLADIAIDRYATEKISLALRMLREDQGLTQSQIPGLSDRHIRRLENEEVRLTSDAADKYARAVGTSLDGFLRQVARRIADLQDDAP